MRTMLLWCCCLGTPVVSFAQTNSTPCTTEPAHVHQVIKKEGWTVPGIDGSHPVSQRIADNKTGSANIFRTQLAPPNGEVLVELAYYILRCDQLEIKQQPFAIRNVSKFDVRGKVFAYFVEGIYVDSVHPPVTYAGAVSFFLFIDTTGTGIFDVYQTDVSFPFRSGLPAWVQKLATAYSVEDPQKAGDLTRVYQLPSSDQQSGNATKKNSQ